MIRLKKAIAIILFFFLTFGFLPLEVGAEPATTTGLSSWFRENLRAWSNQFYQKTTEYFKQKQQEIRERIKRDIKKEEEKVKRDLGRGLKDFFWQGINKIKTLGGQLIGFLKEKILKLRQKAKGLIAE